MKLTTILLPEPYVEALDKMKRERHCSRSALVREGIKNLIEKEGHKEVTEYVPIHQRPYDPLWKKYKTFS
jgi:Arc/MetJ-type ribon-helix-helix transcriptional regulator